MKRCPNPACAFRVRHGFAAEFEDRVERCRSCGGELVEQAPAARVPVARSAFARAGVSAAVLAALTILAGQTTPERSPSALSCCSRP